MLKVIVEMMAIVLNMLFVAVKPEEIMSIIGLELLI